MPSSPGAERIRLALVADNASLRMGGEAAIPYHLFRLMRDRGIYTILITHLRNRVELELAFPQSNDAIFFIEDTLAHRALFALSRRLPRRIADTTTLLLSTLITQYVSRRLLVRLVEEHRLGIVHQPTPVSPRSPSLLSKLGVPLIIGPMNGGMEYPPAMRSGESALTSVFVWGSRKLSGLVHLLASGKRKAELLLVANTRTQASLPFNARNVFVLPENGVVEEEWLSLSQGPGVAERFVFVGRLVDWKRLDIVIKALAKLPEAHLDVIGDGSDRGKWEQLSVRLRVQDRVHFLGSRTQGQCAELLRKSTALVLPSIYECGGAVVLEAMACGVPVIATAWGGPEEYVTSDTGILILPVGEEQMVEDFSHAMQKLSSDRTLCQVMGKNGRDRILKHYTWSTKVDTLISLYQELIDEASAVSMKIESSKRVAV